MSCPSGRVPEKSRRAGLTVCVKNTPSVQVGAAGDHGGMEGGLAGPIGDLIAGVPGKALHPVSRMHSALKR